MWKKAFGSAHISLIEHLGPNRYELVLLGTSWAESVMRRTYSFIFFGCRAGVLPDSAVSMGSFSGYPPSMFGATSAALHVLMCEYTIAVR